MKSGAAIFSARITEINLKRQLFSLPNVMISGYNITSDKAI
jgi:hypothetical protein